MKIRTILTPLIASLVSVASFATGDPVPSVTKNPATAVSVANMPTRSEVLKGDYVTFKHDATNKKIAFRRREVKETYCSPTQAGLLGIQSGFIVSHPGIMIIQSINIPYIAPGEAPLIGSGYCWAVTYLLPADL